MEAGIPLSELPCAQTRVELFGHLKSDWNTFWLLSTDRPVAMGRGAIPWSSIDRIAARYDIVKDDFDRLVDLIHAMDATFLSYKKD